MRFSLEAIHQSTILAQSHLWTVTFPDDSALNALDMGGDIGRVFSAVDVKEPVTEVEYETLSILNNTPVHIPLHVSYYGDLSITLREMHLYQIKSYILDEWINRMHTPGQFRPILDIAKRVYVDKFTRSSGSAYRRSIYWVLPPDKQDFNGTSDIGRVQDTLNFRIIRCERKFDIIGSP